MVSKEGYIYCLSNPSIPGLYKIGKTINSPIERCNDLSSPTGVPVPYEIEFAKEIDDIDRGEKAIHYILDAYRTNDKREFFNISKDIIKQLFDLIKGNYWSPDSPSKLSKEHIEEPISKTKDDLIKEEVNNLINTYVRKTSSAQIIKTFEYNNIIKNILLQYHAQENVAIKITNTQFKDIFQKQFAKYMEYIPGARIVIKGYHIHNDITYLDNIPTKRDSLIQFIDARVRPCDENEVSIKELYRAYCNWFSEEGGGEKVSQSIFEMRCVKKYGQIGDNKKGMNICIFYNDDDIKDFDEYNMTDPPSDT
jgi:hypothetical protein